MIAGEGEAPLVSVVIPCYDQAHFLPEAILSALSQTYPEIEVVVVDDGSPDNIAEVVGRYPTIVFVRQENRGVAEARNAGFRASRGDYLVFLDADDRLTANALESHLACFAQHPDAGFVVGDIDHISLDGSFAGSPRWPLLGENQYQELLRVNHVANTIAVMFRRVVFECLEGFKPSCSPAEDYELLLRAARQFPSRHHRTVVAQYRRHAMSFSRQGAIMLSAMHRVMRMQLPIMEGDSHLRKAWQKGDLYWRDHFGIATIKELWSSLLRLDISRFFLGIAALVRYVRGRVFIIPWKYRRRLLRVLRRRAVSPGERPGRRPNAGARS